MKALEEMYMQTELHYLVNGNYKNIKFNATEMANIFGKWSKDFIDNKSTQEYLEVCCADKNFHEIFGFGTHFSQGDKKFGEDNSPRQNEILTFEDRKNCLIEVKSGGRDAGTWMHEMIALDFAAWLDPHFKFWMIRQIRRITVGYYAEHRKANHKLNEAKAREALYRSKIRIVPSIENYQKLVDAIDDIELYGKAKTKAIKNQVKMDFDFS